MKRVRAMFIYLGVLIVLFILVTLGKFFLNALQELGGCSPCVSAAEADTRGMLIKRLTPSSTTLDYGGAKSKLGKHGLKRPQGSNIRLYGLSIMKKQVVSIWLSK